MKFMLNQVVSPSVHVKSLILAAIFISLNIIFTHILAIQTPLIRISFGFLPVAIFAALFSPIKGAVTAAIADILGCLLFSPGLYFPGFTISAWITGIIYGYFLYNKQPSIHRIIFANISVLVLVDLLLNTVWLILLYHQAAQTILIGRLIKCLIMLPIQVFLINIMLSRIIRQERTHSFISKKEGNLL